MHPRMQETRVDSAGMATIQRRGNSYRVWWRLGGAADGAAQSCTFKAPTPEEALELAELANGIVKARGHDMTRVEVYAALMGEDSVPDPSMPTVKQWVETWLAEMAKRSDLDPETVRKYRRDLVTRAVPWMGHMRLSDITPDTIKDWVAWLSSQRATKGCKNRVLTDRNISAQTIRNVFSTLHFCLGSAVPRWIPLNPAARPAGMRKHPAGLPKVDKHDAIYMTLTERNLILQHCHPAIRNMMIVGLGTGLRLGELVGLQVKHVHLVGASGAVHVRRTAKRGKRFGPPKSAAGRRDVTIGARACQALREQVDGKRPDDFVFTAARGGACDETTVRKLYWKKALAAAQRCVEHPPPAPKAVNGSPRLLRVDEVSTCACPGRLHRLPRIHDWRHSHASDLIAAGWSAKKIQVRLGHSNYQLTMNTYGHLFNTGDDGELAALDMLGLPEPATRARRALAGSVRRRVVRRSAVGRR